MECSYLPMTQPESMHSNHHLHHQNPSEPTSKPSDTTSDPMEVDKASEGRNLRRRKEKIPKHLKREANEKEMDGFTKRVLRIPIDKPFEEVYYTHRLWMFFRETRTTENDISTMFHHIRDKMKQRITLEKKDDPGKFAIPCCVKGMNFPMHSATQEHQSAFYQRLWQTN